MEQNRIVVGYITFSQPLPQVLQQAYVQRLPHAIKHRMQRYQRWQNRQACLLSHLLLQKVLQQFEYTADCLKFVRRDSYGRPGFDASLNLPLDFNLSHTDYDVVCAVSNCGRVGIDIERIRGLELEDFRNCFSAEEWVAIQQSDSPRVAFFDHWTRKEAVMKADGRGLSLALKDVASNREQVRVANQIWHLTPLMLNPSCRCHLACGLADAVKRVHVWQFDRL